jgi:hypothetical protein
LKDVMRVGDIRLDKEGELEIRRWF